MVAGSSLNKYNDKKELKHWRERWIMENKTIFKQGTSLLAFDICNLWLTVQGQKFFAIWYGGESM